jgi:lipopolysaccharide export LptBFGC system permease protein LptF
MTKRETIFLIILGVMMFILSFFPQQTIDNYEVPLLAVVLFPLGLMLATDPERIKKEK